MDRKFVSGSVCIVGAGCGSADLITVRGLKKLMEADTVVYDDLLDRELIENLPDRIEKIYAGKRMGKHSYSQEEINNLLISLAERGKKVCRLKGGDPFVFGRGGEEIQALNDAGISWDVVPGISSCIAIPELEGIPITYRGVSRGFIVVTAHTAEDDYGFSEKLKILAKLDDTIVFLMGLSRLDRIAEELVKAGKPETTPAAVIGDRTVWGTLANIGEKAKNVHAPGVILVGGTAGINLKNI